ncbi:hypothetical protein STTU_3225 [Streptomyces sp. Tu6071]|nr:hypothetical protein CAC01_15255 [Streptomyces sp. CLI2509]EFL01224.1 conserved hypothetical protein [Streptomyces sp. SPB78]EGJ76014.1 hypothetical protein STTU_3225 [Streptomyces sp. Tu6071]MYQ58340.1 hypothetical protein [Streptomyces sp. SID4926]MYR27411.1 hypothetical protein [Streptomyces sp. SID4945]MYX20770.1 hypothetical protein [Streptomyces sp. SID8380]NJA57232.1 hypothetical protein [Streptomyces sp. NEAU-H3]
MAGAQPRHPERLPGRRRGTKARGFQSSHGSHRGAYGSSCCPQPVHSVAHPGWFDRKSPARVPCTGRVVDGCCRLPPMGMDRNRTSRFR